MSDDDQGADARNSETRTSDGVVVVGVGGSAGALGPFRKLLNGLPDDPGLALVFVMHLPADGEDLLPDILGRETGMPVRVVEDGMPIEPNHVYVANPARETAVSEGRFRLQELQHVQGVRASIDWLLRSLAEDRERLAIGIVCSGTGSDGTQGLREIRAAGGVTIVQTPETCEHDSMPRMAIRAGVVDAVLSVEDMPEALLGFARHPYANGGVHGGERDAEADLRNLVRVLRTRSGNDFSGYKSGTLLRRVERRMGLHDVADFDEYVARLRIDGDEMAALCKDLRIRVTNFFRDPEAYEALRADVVPDLLASAAEGGAVRIWVPACATGEEAYSLVMLFREAVRESGEPIDVKVFASDVDEHSIEIARAARYPKSVAIDLPERFLKRYFTERDEEFEVKKVVRESVVFAVQDVLTDPPFSRLDFISCRNLLIYLQPEVQQRLLGLMHFGLREGGYLWLGSAETVGQSSEMFATISREHRIYRRTAGGRERVRFPGESWEPLPPRPAVALPAAPPNLGGWARRMIEDRFVPACVVVDREMQILYFTGETHDFLVQPMGEPTRSLLEMAREGLGPTLRTAIRNAIDGGSATTAESRVRRGRRYFPVSIGIVPLRAPRAAEELFLVSFRDASERPPESSGGDGDGPDEHGIEDARTFEVETLRQELQSTVEQLESSGEEYKAAHEEVRSMNEELQSVNEELKTSKEELQSVNEELSSVNQQLQGKVDQLEDVNNDLGNLLRSTDVATLFLDRELRIQRFTPATRKVFQVLPGDVGRPLSDLAQKFADGELARDAEQVLDDLVPIEREVGPGDGEWYLRRVLPYRTEDDHIDGVVVTFTRITRQKQAERELRELNETLEQRIEERNWCVQLMQDLAVIANEAETVREAVERSLECVGRRLGWSLGHAYLGENGDGVFHDSGLWWVGDNVGDEFDRLAEISRQTTFGTGEGLVGRVVRGRRALLWSVEDEAGDVHFRRADALAAAALRHVFAFPILVGGEVAGVLEFFGRDAAVREELLEDVGQLGTHLGRVVERQRARRALRAAVNETLHVEERERRDLAEALHDELGQLLAVMRMRLDDLHANVDETTRGRLEDVEALVARASESTRSLTFQLSPPILYELGLKAALEWLADELYRLYALVVTVEGQDDPEAMDDRLRFLLFRSARELLVNVAKHAETKEVTLTLAVGETISLAVADGGLGFEVHEPLYEVDGGFGLFSVRERVEHLGGRMRIESRNGEGTRVEIELPLGSSEGSASRNEEEDA